MKHILYRRRVGLGVAVLLFGMMVAVVPSFALPHGSVVREKVKEKKKERRQVPEGDMLSMLGLSLGVLSCGVVARRRVVQP
jgi:hypothetical protein